MLPVPAGPLNRTSIILQADLFRSIRIACAGLLASIWVNGAKVYRPGNHCYAGPKGRLRREERVFKTMRGTVAVFGRETNAALFAHDCATLDLPEAG